MSNGGAVGGAAAAIANAIKASGVVVRVNPDDFQSLLARAKETLVVHGTGGLFSTKYRYISSIIEDSRFTRSRRSRFSYRRMSRRFVWRRFGYQTDAPPSTPSNPDRGSEHR